MPNIQGYEAPSGLGLTPTEIGVESTAAAGRRLGAYGNQIAEAKSQTGRLIGSAISDAGKVAVDYEDHREISAGAATGTQLFDSLTQSKDAAIKDIDPNDPLYGQKVDAAVKQWREEKLQPALDKFSQGFNTEKSQAWAQQFVDKTRDHMFVSSAADITSAAKIGITNSIRTIANTASNTAVQDPSSVPTQLDLVEHSIDGLVASSPVKGIASAAIKSEVLEKTREQIVKSGAVGAIQKSNDPERTAAEWTAKYPQYINGQEAIQLAGNARQQIRANNYDIEQNRRRDKEIATDKSNNASDQYLIDIRSKDPRLASDPTAKKVLNDPNLLRKDKNNLLNYIRTINQPETEARVSQDTFVGLLRDLRKPDADPDQVMQKAWDARAPADEKTPSTLSEKDFNQFRAEVVARKTPEGAALEHDRNLFFKQYTGSIAGNTYNAQLGDPKIYNAETDARRMETMLKQKGLDPHLAYDPSSEYFLGRPERIAKWAGGMQQDLATRAEAPAKTAQPEVPFSLRGIADLSRNKKTGQYRDNVSGKVYAADGSEIKQ